MQFSSNFFNTSHVIMFVNMWDTDNFVASQYVYQYMNSNHAFEKKSKNALISLAADFAISHSSDRFTSIIRRVYQFCIKYLTDRITSSFWNCHYLNLDQFLTKLRPWIILFNVELNIEDSSEYSLLLGISPAKGFYYGKISTSKGSRLVSDIAVEFWDSLHANWKMRSLYLDDNATLHFIVSLYNSITK